MEGVKLEEIPEIVRCITQRGNSAEIKLAMDGTYKVYEVRKKIIKRKGK